MMTAGATEHTRRAAPTPRASARSADDWQRTTDARQRVAELLHVLPQGFVVYHDLQLPKPSRAIIDHLVIGPRGVWAVTTDVFADAIAEGRGRNADTLWAGRTPLRSLLEAADWESSAISELIGHPVEPLVCLVAPALPKPAFDFHGIRICQPEALTRQVALSTADFVDVTVVADVVQRVFATDPASETVLPTLGTAVLPPQLRPTVPRRRRSLGARLHAIRNTRAARGLTIAVLVAGVVAFFPAIVNVWNSVAAEGAERLTGVIDDRASAGDPSPVGYVMRCESEGTGWTVEWAWPGDLPPDAAGYGIRTQIDGAPARIHTVRPWSDRTTPPPPVRLVDPSGVTVFTDHLADDGSTLATTDEQIVAPSTRC